MAQSARDLVPQNSAAKRRIALVIGNAEYPGRSLANSVHDAEDMKSTLESVGFTVALGTDLSRAAMETRIQKFVESIHSGDLALFYFAGHGMQIDNENLLIPVDFEDPPEGRVKESCVRFDEVQKKLQASSARLSIMVMDACRNNPYRRSTRAWTRGLAPVDAALGLYVAFAASPGQTAADNPTGRNGLFTKFVLEQLRKPVPLSQLFRNVREQVHQASAPAYQTPYIQDQMLGDIYFIEGKDTPAPPQPVQATEKLLDEGLRLYGQGKCAEALPAFDRAVRSDPENPFAHNAAGMTYVCQKTPARAIEHFNMAIRLKPDLAGAYLNRGMVYLETGKYKLAVEDFTWAIDEQPDTSLYYSRRGQAYFGIREYQDALADFSRAIELNPADSQAYYGRGKVHQQRADYQKALADFNAALDRKPDYPEARQERDNVQRRLSGR